MRNIIIPVIVCLTISACSGSAPEKQKSVCQAEFVTDGFTQLVHVYGVRRVANQTEYRAGYPFNWRWVNKNSFTSSNCPQ